MTDESDQTVDAIRDDLNNYNEESHVLILDSSGNPHYVGDISERVIKGVKYVVIEMAGGLSNE